MEALLLRLEAPLVSFGATQVDRHGPSDRFPSTSLLTGLLGNALGWDHADTDRLQGLQERLRFAARLDRAGEGLLDYQSVDLGQPQFAGPGRTTWRGPGRALEPRPGWTTRAQPEGRSGGDANVATHIRLRDYRADVSCLVALTLAPAEADPTLAQLAAALAQPERPLFIGRKPCLPAAPILVGPRPGPSLLAVLAAEPCDTRLVEVQWPADEAVPDNVLGIVYESVSDTRDWANQVHTGTRRVGRGRMRILARPDDPT